MRVIASLFIFSLLAVPAMAQYEEVPTDYLSKEFHQEKRDAFRSAMPANSAAVIFGSTLKLYANDVDYPFHQDPDLYYLTGYQEHDGVLLLFSEPHLVKGESVSEVMFVLPRDEFREMWNGRRLGAERALGALGIEAVYPNTLFATLTKELGLAEFDKVLIPTFPEDARNDLSNTADMHDLVSHVQQLLGLTGHLSMVHQQLYLALYRVAMGDSHTMHYVEQTLSRYPELAKDPVYVAWKNAATVKEKLAAVATVAQGQLDMLTPNAILDELRSIKSDEEIRLMRTATAICAQGQMEVMKAMHENMSELEVQGIHQYVYRKFGAEYEGYPSICGSGDRANVLHYILNNRLKIKDDLILMDVGAEYHGYTGDVTRTVPGDGTFSEEQKAIYEIVLKAQEAAIQKCQVGTPFRDPHWLAVKIINQGLADLGIISSPDADHRYFPHGTSHYVGLDVHDRGDYGPLRDRQIITVEPGIYIPEGSPCDEKWWGIGVRIEDCILITPEGPENLSGQAPRDVQSIEAMMALPSALDDFLPNPTLDIDNQ